MTDTATTLTHDHEHHDADPIDVFGFWFYILSDCILFATLFAGFAVLQGNTYGGPPLHELFSLPYVLVETMFLLFSSFTYGLGMMAMYQGKRNKLMMWLGVTVLLGLSFVIMEVNEFVHLVAEGHSWQSSGALSAFFTLVGTHGLHVTIGLIWMVIMIFQLARFKLTGDMKRRLTYLGLFWAFLDIVWIFVFTFVYLMGAV